MPHRHSPFRLWIPLALTSLMMSAELPIIQSFITRLLSPHENLAAFSFALQLSMLFYSPTFGLVSASVAFVRDQESYRRCFVLASTVIALTTALIALASIPPIFRFLAIELNGLDPAVASAAFGTFVCALAWPTTVGFRRFYQGILIRHRQSHAVTRGTILRIVALFGSGFLLLGSGVSGALLGGLVLIVGTAVELVAVQRFSQPIIRSLAPRDSSEKSADTLSHLAQFYWPIALTSLVSQFTQPMVFAALGRLPNHISLLAAYPVAFALIWLFVGCAFAAQEVIVALLADGQERKRDVRRFAHTLAAALFGISLFVSLPAVSYLWFTHVVGLPADLLPLAQPACLALTPIAPLFVYQTLIRAELIVMRSTFGVSLATVAELIALGIMLVLLPTLFESSPLIGVAVAVNSSKAVGIICLWFVRQRVK